MRGALEAAYDRDDVCQPLSAPHDLSIHITAISAAFLIIIYVFWSSCFFSTDLLPPRDRPKTTAAVAKRLLSHALGMNQLRDREAERDLAQQRKASDVAIVA